MDDCIRYHPCLRAAVTLTVSTSVIIRALTAAVLGVTVAVFARGLGGGGGSGGGGGRGGILSGAGGLAVVSWRRRFVTDHVFPPAVLEPDLQQ